MSTSPPPANQPPGAPISPKGLVAILAFVVNAAWLLDLFDWGASLQPFARCVLFGLLGTQLLAVVLLGRAQRQVAALVVSLLLLGVGLLLVGFVSTLSKFGSG
jgi:hypothetical protein